MFQTAISYRNYLDLLKRAKKTSPVKRVFITAFALVFIIIGFISALLYYDFQKEAPIRAEKAYLEIVEAAFISSSQSVDEVLESGEVAGTKIKFIDKLQEATAASLPLGFSVSLDEINKTLAQIESTKNIITTNKSQLEKLNAPSRFSNLNTALLTYHKESQLSLDAYWEELAFAKKVLIALGPSFYLPVLSDENLWANADREKIIDYYKNAKENSKSSLEAFSKITPPQKFEGYFKAQNDYIVRIVTVSDNIISVLSQKDTQNVDEATQIEKAYQVLVGAQRDNQQLSENLLQERLKFVDLKSNLERFAQVKVTQNSLKGNLEEEILTQPQPKTLLFLAQPFLALYKQLLVFVKI